MKDPVDTLTPLGLTVLALLDEGDMHPYEMIRLMRQRHDDRLVRITNGTVYNTVGRLQHAALLTEVGIDRDGRRPERTTYSLTDLGRAALAEWVRRELSRIDRPAEFRVALAEAHNLERDEVVGLLGIRRSSLAAALAELEGGAERASVREVPTQYLLEVERELALLTADLDWLDGLIARLVRHDFLWGKPTLPSARYLEDRKAARL